MPASVAQRGHRPIFEDETMPLKSILLLLGFNLFATLSFAADKPNILFLLADDLGHGDLSSYGCTDTRTSNIDSLARDGLKFTQFYASASECTPTRATFLTGRYPQRVGGLEYAIGLSDVGRYDDA